MIDFKKGDLVRLSILSPGKNHGGITAIKFFIRLKTAVGGKVGIVIKAGTGKNIVVQFDNMLKVIHEKYLEVIN